MSEPVLALIQAVGKINPTLAEMFAALAAASGELRLQDGFERGHMVLRFDFLNNRITYVKSEVTYEHKVEGRVRLSP